MNNKKIVERIRELRKGCKKKWSYSNKHDGVYERYVCSRGFLCKICEAKVEILKEFK